MTSEPQADIRRPDKEASNVARENDSKVKEPNVPFGLGSVRKENDDLTGRAYQYFHKLQ
jgi:hypothetical protein